MGQGFFHNIIQFAFFPTKSSFSSQKGGRKKFPISYKILLHQLEEPKFAWHTKNGTRNLVQKVMRFCCVSYLAPVDVLLLDKYPSVGEGSLVKEHFESLAGDGSIVAAYLSKAGEFTRLIAGTVGKDNRSKRIIKFLKELRVEIIADFREDRVAPRVFVICSARQQRTWMAYVLKTTFSTFQNHSDFINFDYFYLDLYEINYAWSVAILEKIKSHGLSKIVHVNVSTKHEFEQHKSFLINQKVSFVQFSLPESVPLEPELYYSPFALLVTHGRRGAYIFHENSYEFVPAKSITPFHTHGAGAAFSAGFVLNYCRTKNARRAMEAGTVLAAHHCSNRNPIDAINFQILDL